MTGEHASTEHLEFEDLRRTDATMRRVRVVGAAFALVQFTAYRPPPGIEVPFNRHVVAAVVVAALLAVNLVSRTASVRVDGLSRLRLIGYGQLVADALLVSGITWMFAFDPVSALWALLVVPVIEGGIRAQMRGALVTWAGVLVVYVGREVWASATFATHTLDFPSITYRMGIVLVVAAAAGYLSGSLREQMLAQRATTATSERRAELLKTVAAASRTMSLLDVEQVLDQVVDATVQIGFEGVELCFFDEGATTYKPTHTRGLPESYTGMLHPTDAGIAGEARRTRRTVVIDDYGSWEGAMAEVKPLGFEAAVACPIWCGSDMAGVLCAGTRKRRGVLDNEIESLELLAAQAGSAILNARRYVERLDYEQRLTHQILHDLLTGLPNRRLFLERLNHALMRRIQTSLAVLFVDLDDFKRVNDSLGHECGDALLRKVAERLQGCIRASDTVARFGGDEFTILLEDLTGVEDALQVASGILKRLEDRFAIGDHEVFMSASIGLSMGTSGEVSDRDLLHEADLAMYRAKQQGGSRCEVFRAHMVERARRRMQTENELRRALAERQLMLHYQPIISVTTGELAGAEALIRWRHPVRGTVMPASFVPLAEETGLILPISRFVLEEACNQRKAWERAGVPADIWVSVNLSAKDLHQPDVVDSLLRIIDRTQANPAHIVCEVTESAILFESSERMLSLERLRREGVRLAIDDFGLGYSSLSRLRRFAADMIKIDRTFIAGLGRHPQDSAIVRAVLRLAGDLGITVIAEGVETTDQLERLQEINCDLAQGFSLGPPVSGDKIPGAIAARQISGPPTVPHGS